MHPETAPPKSSNKFNFYKSTPIRPLANVPIKPTQAIIKNHGYVQDIIREKYAIQPSSSIEKPRGMDRTVRRYSMTEKSNKPVFSRMFKPPVILDKKHRNDPFHEIPSVSENEFKKGLNYLLNKGIIPKDYDLTPAFEKGHPPIEKAKIRLAPFQSQF